MSYPISNDHSVYVPDQAPSLRDPPLPIQPLPANYQCDNPQQRIKLANYLEASSQQSSISNDIYRIAEQQGIKVTVLSNDEYDKRYAGTGGVTVGPADAREVIIPERSLENPANTTLEHELLHAYVETDGSRGKALYDKAVDSSLSPEERQAAAAELFKSIGGTAEQGKTWAEGLQGIPQDVLRDTGDHMLNSATDRLIYRQKSGQSLDTPFTLTIMRNAAKGEAAMHLRSQLNPDEKDSQPTPATIISVFSALRSMYGDEVPAVWPLDVAGSKATLDAYLNAKIDDFNNTRDAYATN